MLLRPVLMPVLRNPMQGITDSVRDYLAELRGSSAFWADLTHTAIPIRSAGETATFTRASTATFRDWEGVLRTVPSGCARFEGARMVRNLVASSEDLTSGWAANNAGSVTATTITFTASAGDGWNVTAFSGTAGNVYVWSCLVSTDSGTKNIRFRVGGAALSANVQVTTTPVRVSVVMTATAAVAEFGIYNGSDAVAGAINCTEIQLEDVTGQTDQTAGEYVSVGVESAPYYHGSMVDGVKCFGTDLAGAALTTMTRYKPEPAATQIIAATADIRDMTTANWALGATMTRARTSVGADGAANSATRLTGGAVAATNTILYTVTAAASSRTYSALVRRVTGTGPVRIVQTGTETDISSQLSTTGYTLVELNASVLNVAIGFKIDTNGDAIDVDFNQFEAGATATSRITTGGGTRDLDDLTYTGGNVANFKTLHAGFRREAGVSGLGSILDLDDGSGNNRQLTYLNSATHHRFDGLVGGATQWDIVTSNPYTPGTDSKVAWSAATNSILMDKDGTAQTADTSATLPTVTQLQIGHLNGASVLNGNVGPIAAWTRNLSQSEIAAIDRA